MRFYGYHRTSTTDQHIERGLTEIRNYCDNNKIDIYQIFTDQRTGKDFNRPNYQYMKSVLRDGDILIITEIDRLGRNKQGTMKELEWFKENHIRLMVLEIPTTLMDLCGMDNEMARLMLETINNLMIEIYVTIAEAEMHKKEKRQREGIEAMRNRGEWDKMGRPRVMEQAVFNREFERVVSGEIAPFELIKELGMKRQTYYKYKKVYEENIKNQSCPI